jgi:hypothetical protein
MSNPVTLTVEANFNRKHPEWIPEAGSPAWVRAVCDLSGLTPEQIEQAVTNPPIHLALHNPRNKGWKIHWEGGVSCASVMNYRLREKTASRILKGNAFDTIPMGRRCGKCNEAFLNS